MKNSKSLHEKITKGIEQGVAAALLKHKENDRPIYIWENGKIVEIPPERIQIEECPNSHQ